MTQIGVFPTTGIFEFRGNEWRVLAQMGAGKSLVERPHFDESVSIAISHLGHEDPLVAHSAAWALAHLQSDVAISALIEARKCTDSRIRLAVAYGMAGSERPDAISTLMELMEDADDEVRNWATFGLSIAGSESGPPVRLGTLDLPNIREALRNRLADSVGEVVTKRFGVSLSVETPKAYGSYWTG